MTSSGGAGVRPLCVVCEPFGATQFISFAQPLGGALHVVEASRFEKVVPTLEALGHPAAVVLSRVTLCFGERVARLCRAKGVPVVFHLDDDLLDVPDALGEAKAARYRDPERLRQLRANMEACDLVYASTRPLADRLRDHGIAAPIVAGRLYCSIDPVTVGRSLPSRVPVLGYMGTGGHARDLDQVVPAIERVMALVPDLQFEVFGTIALPAGLAPRWPGRVRRHEPVKDYPAFLARLRALGWWVGLAPIEDHSFNRCKADTKWVEYGLAGIAVVASDLPVYHRACEGGAGTLAADEGDWMNGILRLLRDERLRAATVAAARARLAAEYTHEVLRRQLEEVLDLARQRRGASGALPSATAALTGSRGLP